MSTRIVEGTRGALFALVLAGLVPVAGQAQEAADETFMPPSYTVNPGDRLSVTVWKEEDLQRQVLVRPDGFFSFPLAGDIRAIGRTVEDIRGDLTEQLSRYIPDPVVTVATEEIPGNKFYVIGQVNRPGEFIASTQIDVLQALAIAGGTTPFASLGGIKVLRRSRGVLKALEFDYGDIEKGRRLNQNILLKPGDVVVVP